MAHAGANTMARMTTTSITELAQQASDLEVLTAIFGPYEGPMAARKRIEAMEMEMATMPQVLGDMPLFHHYAAGLYARELHVPAGTMLTGAIHKSEHMNIVLKGDISVMTEDGLQRVRAPALLVSRPGTKRIGFAHEDTVWLTIHASTATTPEAAWHELIAEGYDDVPGEPITIEQFDKPSLLGEPLEIQP